MVHNVLSCLGMDESEFFKEGFEASGATIRKDEDPFRVLSLHLENLESKLDYVTDCVDSEQRKSIPVRFTELMTFMNAQESALTECKKSLEHDGYVTDDCILAYYYSIMNYGTRFRRSNRIIVVLKKISESEKKLGNTTILLVYIVTGMLIFLKLIQEFVGIYERKQRRKAAVNMFERTAFLIEIGEGDERNGYGSEGLNKNAENKIMDELKDLEIQLFQVLDMERISEMEIAEDDCKSICQHTREVFINSRDMFFNQKVMESEIFKNFVKSVCTLTAWLDSSSDTAPYRLFLTNERIKAIKSMSSWLDNFFEAHYEDWAK